LRLFLSAPSVMMGFTSVPSAVSSRPRLGSPIPSSCRLLADLSFPVSFRVFFSTETPPRTLFFFRRRTPSFFHLTRFSKSHVSSLLSRPLLILFFFSSSLRIKARFVRRMAFDKVRFRPTPLSTGCLSVVLAYQ